MDIVELRKQLHKLIDEIDDEEILRAILTLLTQERHR